MAAPNAATPAAAPESSSLSSDQLSAKAVHKRYEGLVTVRTKAFKGKGAWYWAHLEPILLNNPDTGLPKAVKLRCSLCDALFSASNPSRTASEHLKRGTCPNFALLPKPLSSLPSSSSSSLTVATISPSPQHHHRKRTSSSALARGRGTGDSAGVPPLAAIVDPSRFDLAYPPPPPPPPPVAIATTSRGLYEQQNQNQSPSQNPHQHLVLSGGKEDLGALAMLEDSVKRLKSPKSSPGQTLSKSQVDSALDCLADWLYDCCGSVSFSSLDHPKFKSFLNLVGLPSISKTEFVGSRLDAKYEEAKADSEDKIRDAMFFQIATDGWKSRNPPNIIDDDNFVHLAINLPNGTSVFRKAVFCSGYVHWKYSEDILWDTVVEICGTNGHHQCVGIVSDRFRSTALKNLENKNPCMVNLCCQYQGFVALIKDLSNQLPLFTNVIHNCFKLGTFINNTSQLRHCFHKYQLQEYGHAGLLRVQQQTYPNPDSFSMVEDVLGSSRALHLLLVDELYKKLVMDDPVAREIEEMMRNPHFWNELEAVHSLVKLIKSMAQEIETEKPRIGQCLPLWEELRVKVREWCSKFHVPEGALETVIDKRFKKNYHPAWAAAFILDPLYLIRDTSGKYLPPFKCLTPEQEKDVDKLITRLVSREEAHIALMELMRWRTEGLDPVYAQAVQMKQRDPNTGKMRIANPHSSRLVWERYMTEFKSLRKVAVRLIFLHATSRGFKCNLSLVRWMGAHSHSRVGMDRAQKVLFIAANSRMEKRDEDDDKDTELLYLANGEDDVLNEVFVDTSSV